jgi:tetratricopeptide (TPR) repeat protein
VLAQGPSEAELRPLSSALTLIEANEWRVAEARLTDGLREFPRSAVLSNAMGVVYEQEDRPAEAIRAYEQAIEWLPGFTDAQLHLASLYAGTGQCDGATPR